MPCSPNSTPCARFERLPCADFETQSLRFLDAIVRAYCNDYRDAATREYAYWANHSSFNLAIQTAALSTLPCGKRHPHQRRIPANTLRCAAYSLTKQGLAASGTFHDLHQTVHATISNIGRIGELAVYDIACRIGAYLGLTPDRVYLHAGTRRGARALALRGSSIGKQDLPRAFQVLSPAEIEDCLCIYKNQLLRLGPASRR